MKKVSEVEYKKALARIEDLLPLVDEDTPKEDPNIIELGKVSEIVESYELDHNTFLASRRDKEIFFHALLNPGEPNEELKKAATIYNSLKPNIYWKYCIMAHKDPNGDISFGIHEVYYENDIPYAYTENPVAASGDSPKEVKKNLRMMLNDTKEKPIIWTGVDFPKEYLFK